MPLSQNQTRCAAALIWAAIATCTSASAQSDPPLDSGFHEMYELKFDAARGEFLAYQKSHPDDPLGKAAEAASYLFQEFNEKGVFTSAFFLNDKKLLGGVDGQADPARCQSFLTANQRARELAQQRLKSNPKDKDGLFVVTIADGMEADYDALIARRQLASLSMIRKAEAEGAKLLAVDPKAQDANLALGAGNYIIGSLPSYKRMFLWFGGVHGDRQRGMEQLAAAATHGHYLQPFAKALLALASEREHQPERARLLLADLVQEFPENPVFVHELALAQKSSGSH